MIIPALSVRQPWPHAIFCFGKNVENRSWPLPPAYDDRLVLIHAGVAIDEVGLSLLKDDKHYLIPDPLPMGGIVGYAVFSRRAGLQGGSEWAVPGFYHWAIIRAGKLPFYPCKGRLRFFDVNYPHQSALSELAWDKRETL